MQGKYRHYKGKEYQVLYVAKNSETLEEMVVYQALYGNQELWVRPKNMFCEIVNLDDGRAVSRFERID